MEITRRQRGQPGNQNMRNIPVVKACSVAWRSTAIASFVVFGYAIGALLTPGV